MGLCPRACEARVWSSAIDTVMVILSHCRNTNITLAWVKQNIDNNSAKFKDNVKKVSEKCGYLTKAYIEVGKDLALECLTTFQ